jgi:hypothetical protein
MAVQDVSVASDQESIGIPVTRKDIPHDLMIGSFGGTGHGWNIRESSLHRGVDLRLRQMTWGTAPEERCPVFVSR